MKTCCTSYSLLVFLLCCLLAAGSAFQLFGCTCNRTFSAISVSNGRDVILMRVILLSCRRMCRSGTPMVCFLKTTALPQHPPQAAAPQNQKILLTLPSWRRALTSCKVHSTCMLQLSAAFPSQLCTCIYASQLLFPQWHIR